jgi:DNA polymerase-4
VIYEAACKLFLDFWNHSPIRLLGVRATKLDENEFSQVSLFDSVKHEKLNKLDSAIDQIRNKFGTDAVKRASFLKDDSICMHRLGKN